MSVLTDEPTAFSNIGSLLSNRLGFCYRVILINLLPESQKVKILFVAEDELTSKQTEISGLKNSVAELVRERPIYIITLFTCTHL